MGTAEPKLGERVREIISGYEGVVTGAASYLWGCRMLCVSRADKDGKPESEWFDVGRLELDASVPAISALPHTPVGVTGGDREPPKP